MIFYLAGRMTGLPGFNFDAFDKACEHLRGVMKLNVKSPHEINYGETDENRGSLSYETYIKGGLKLLLECDAIILMDGWELSSGAVNELIVARCCAMKVFFYDSDTGILTTNARIP